MVKPKSSGGFEWPVPGGIQGWITAMPIGEPSEPARFLTDAIPRAQRSHSAWAEEETVELEHRPSGETEFANDSPSYYEPLTKSGLFLIFAGLPPTEDPIARFANKYGLLGPPVSTRIRIDAGEGRWYEEEAERFDSWVAEIGGMHDLVGLWKALGSGGREDILCYLPCAAKVWRSVEIWELVWRSSNPASCASAWPMQKLRDVAYTYLAAAVNKKLEGRMSAKLPVFSPLRSDDIPVQPDGLLGALWYQFGRAIVARKQYRQCQECGTWYEISPETARTNKLFCSTACRSRAYRKRQEEARALNAEGVPAYQIARRLDSDVETVRGWLKAGARKGR
jgi:hypothetical protein